MKFSMLYNDGRSNYQVDFMTIGGAIMYYEKNHAVWAIVVDVSNGEVVHKYKS